MRPKCPACPGGRLRGVGDRVGCDSCDFSRGRDVTYSLPTVVEDAGPPASREEAVEGLAAARAALEKGSDDDR